MNCVMMKSEKKKAHRIRAKRKIIPSRAMLLLTGFFSFFFLILLFLLLLPLLFHQCSHKKEGLVGI